MRPIPPKLKQDLLNDPYYKRCCLSTVQPKNGVDTGVCDGRVTFEHAIIFKGRQLNEKWAIIPLCEKHHAVNQYQDAGTMNKELSEWIAINRASNQELRAVSKAIDYQHKKDYLNDKYGIPSTNVNL